MEVDYDPEQVTLSEMVRALRSESSFYSVVAGEPGAYDATRKEMPEVEVTRLRGKPSFIEPKHSLRTRFPDLYYLDLTEKQAIVLNSWSYFGGPMPDVLLPRQLALRHQLDRKIRKSGRPPFHPLRQGEGRERYHEALLAWLNTP